MKTTFAMLCLACVTYAQTPVLGDVSSKTLTGLTLKTDDGNVNIAITPETKILRVRPGETNLTSAETISVSDVNTGDRILLQPNQVIVMSRSDLEKQQSTERADWQARGHAGKVTEVTAEAFTIQTPRGETLGVTTSSRTIFRRYAGSIRLGDARPSTFAELRAGDQLRVLGERVNGQITAEVIVFGTFRNIAGTVISANGSTGELVLADLESKQPVTVKVTAETTARRLPPQMADILAQRRSSGLGEGMVSRTTPPGAPPAGNRAQPGGLSNVVAGGSLDLGQMLDRMPALTLAELKPGDAVLVASAAEADASRATAISIVGGVEPLLTGPPSDRRLSGPWSLDFNIAP